VETIIILQKVLGILLFLVALKAILGYHFMWEKCSCCGRRYRNHKHKVSVGATSLELDKLDQSFSLTEDVEKEKDLRAAEDKCWEKLGLYEGGYTE
jgi:hypothetical protein